MMASESEWQRHREVARRAALQMGASAEEAEDAAQDAIIALLERDPERPGPYARRVAQRAAIAARARRTIAVDPSELDGMAATPPTQESAVSAREDLEVLEGISRHGLRDQRLYGADDRSRQFRCRVRRAMRRARGEEGEAPHL